MLTIDEVAAIKRRTVAAIRKQVQRRTFVPAPAETRPYRWRKVDVLRYVEGARGASLQKVGS